MKEPNNCMVFAGEAITLDKYIENKLLILEEFKIPLDKHKIAKFKSLTSETAVDRYARSLITERLGEN